MRSIILSLTNLTCCAQTESAADKGFVALGGRGIPRPASARLGAAGVAMTSRDMLENLSKNHAALREKIVSSSNASDKSFPPHPGNRERIENHGLGISARIALMRDVSDSTGSIAESARDSSEQRKPISEGRGRSGSVYAPLPSAMVNVRTRDLSKPEVPTPTPQLISTTRKQGDPSIHAQTTVNLKSALGAKVIGNRLRSEEIGKKDRVRIESLIPDSLKQDADESVFSALMDWHKSSRLVQSISDMNLGSKKAAKTVDRRGSDEPALKIQTLRPFRGHH